ncbi:TRAP transporter small permease subunit [Rhodobacteraceae bacterium F11138]|nr:TRAP transporter small permease subunit [Rhodobacteraceae bacterium F11138]
MATLRRRIMLVASLLSGAMLLGLTAVTVVDVVGRYVLNSPLSGASEMTELLLIGVIFLGIPAITIDQDHLLIDLVTDHFRGAFKDWHHLLVQAIVMGFFAVTGWQVLEHAARLETYGEATVYLGVPYAPIARIAGGLLIFSAFVVLWQIAGRLLRIR